MKKFSILITILVLTSCAHQNIDTSRKTASNGGTKILYGLSLEKSALVIEDFKSEGMMAERLGPNECATSTHAGQFCVVATGNGITKVLYGMSLEQSALVIEDFKSEGLSAERLNPSQCDQSTSHSGDYCVVARP